MKNTINKISIIIPVYNESENLEDLYTEVCSALHALPYAWEFFFVDDGSADTSLQVLHALSCQDSRVRYISFARNAGQSAAFAAGFRHAQGDVFVTMDADLQNDPADIPAMLDVYVQGVDMVVGWRARRQDTMVKRYASRIANWIRNTISHETIKDTGCSLKVMRADMARKIPMFTGMHRFLPTLMKLEGACVREVQVHHRPRSKGVSKYGIWDRAWASAYDLLAVRWMQKRYISFCINATNMHQDRSE